MKLLFVTVSMMILIASGKLSAQGCSDAGFCTLHGLRSDKEETQLQNSFRAGIARGEGDNEIEIWSTYFEYYRTLSKQLSLGARINYISENSPSLSNGGFSDMFVSGSFLPSENIEIVAGFKIPFNNANEKFDSVDVGLPMGFQTSLGTFDLILGVGYRWKGLKLDAAYQQPLTQNENSYLSTAFPPGAPFGQYQSTNKFERSADLLLRASYDLRLSNEWFINAGLLPIFHLSNDKYTDSSGTVTEIDGSSGLTFNGNLMIEFRINQNNAVVAGVSAPFITRDSRPDGLGRKYMVNLDYKIMF